MSSRIGIFVICALTWMLAHPVWASGKVALVIGNAEYEHVSRPNNPVNDATDIGAALARLGFEVTRLENVGLQDMRRGLQKFDDAASGAEIAVVFYAGHSVEVDKNNFLIPADTELQSAEEIEFETVSLDLVQRSLDGVTGLGLVILDACRDSPFANRVRQSGGARNILKVPARVDPTGKVLIAYAGKDGQCVADGTGRNSPYTKALLAHLEKPGLELGRLFRKVSATVREATGSKHQPVVYGSLPDEDIYLVGLLLEPEPSTPQDELPLTAPNPEGIEVALNLTANDRELVQRALNDAGFKAGAIDGVFGRKTRTALKGWQKRKGKPETGYLTEAQLAVLRSEGERSAERQREEAKAQIASRGRALRSKHGDEAMHWAARNGDVDVMKWLKAQGASVNERENNGGTPMHNAALKGDVAAMKWLKAQGASVNVRDKYGDTPMHDAAAGGHVAAMKWLKAQGASVNVRSNNGITPLGVAEQFSQVAVANWLRANGGRK